MRLSERNRRIVEEDAFVQDEKRRLRWGLLPLTAATRGVASRHVWISGGITDGPSRLLTVLDLDLVVGVVEHRKPAADALFRCPGRARSRRRIGLTIRSTLLEGAAGLVSGVLWIVSRRWRFGRQVDNIIVAHSLGMGFL